MKIGFAIWVIVVVLILFISHKMKKRFSLFIDGEDLENDKLIQRPAEKTFRKEEEYKMRLETYLFVDKAGIIHEEFLHQL